jgi:hypothetical protein
VIDCGEVGFRGRGGHGHNDATSFELHLNGMNVISDCGAYLYTASREWRNRFRSTAFHNVVQAGAEELNRFVGEDALWQLHDDARPVGVVWEAVDGGGYFRGGHDGYRRLQPPLAVTREIFVEPTEPRVALRDRVDGGPGHQLTWRFHLDPAVTADVIDRDCRLRCDDREVWMLAGDDDRRERRVERGWVSPSYGVRHETAVIVIEDRAPATLACIFAEAPLGSVPRQELWERVEARAARAR